MATTAHLTVHELLRALENGSSTRRLASRVLWHLRGLCPECDRVYREYEAVRRRRRARRDYTEAFHSAQEAAAAIARHMEEEEPEARSQARQIVGRHAGKRLALLRQTRSRFRSPVLVPLLVEQARSFLKAKPAEALDLLNVAEAVCRRISRPDYGESLVERLLIWVEAHRANALRVLGELLGADLLWTSVHRRRLSCPLIDPGEEAELASLEASLRQDQRRFEDALRLLAAAERYYGEAGDPVGVGKVLTKRGSVLYLAGESERAINTWQRAAELLDHPANEEPYLMTQHNQALALVDLGRLEEAAALLALHERRFDAFDDRWAKPLRAWVAARLARARGQSIEAEKAFHAARNGYLEQRHGLNAALVTLDLSQLYLAQGNLREVKRLAGLMEPIFEAQDVHAEAIRALRLFEKAALGETITADLLDRIRRFLEATRHDRRLRFESPEAPGAQAAPPPPRPAPAPRRDPARQPARGPASKESRPRG